MKIGYQGIPGCHSLRAARLLASEAGIYEPEYVSLGSPENVVNSLMKGSIDYGVVAMYDSAVGDIKETHTALDGVRYMKVTAAVMPVHYCVFKADSSAGNTEINKAVSCADGIERTKKAVSRYFPNAKTVRTEDDTLAAKALSEGGYDRYTAVICGREAGSFYGLTLAYENIEDGAPESKLFYLISRVPKQQ